MAAFDNKKSELQHNPKSKVFKHGYINFYSDLNPKEQRQIAYKELYKEKSPDWDESMVFLSRRFKEIFKGREDLVILDAGCGNGNFIVDENRHLISWGVGVDVKPEFTSKNVCLDQIEYGTLEKLPFEDNTFDAVVSLWVLEHIKNAPRVFGEINRVLKPGGYFLFATPNKNFLPVKVIDLLKSAKINHTLNKVLFGREPEDVFEAYYVANTLKDIKDAKGAFEIVDLKPNYDPGYTSFNSISFSMSTFLGKFSAFKPHIVGVLKKK